MVAGFFVSRTFHTGGNMLTMIRLLRCFISTSRDMTARLYTLHPLDGFRPKTFAGHKDAVMNAYFSQDEKTVCIWCVSQRHLLTPPADLYCQS